MQVLGVAFQRDYKLSYPSLHDPAGKQFLKLPRGVVNAQVLPFSLFVDRSGKIAGMIRSAVSEEDLRSIVDLILKEDKRTSSAKYRLPEAVLLQVRLSGACRPRGSFMARFMILSEVPNGCLEPVRRRPGAQRRCRWQWCCIR
ncbi:hypothetical protein J7E91_07645 [Streptomyces sp. ISL-99]|uniref:TlpA family protein disulfide reductase n=1 Tax=Streptomyces sp. ISL-99 TaxID=2819193 RepID=UPI001BEA0ACF|nr:hypothetical protein [Streptomyces sp. ISL-99]MBT2525311.1 hypothetical protein [Streptomyces sp. ISL-99]